ncbi:hypothetical protein IG631_14069 [Alternaria alternata]|nr:hypothetical protein IG631_14069 [Alternaria alternata]
MSKPEPLTSCSLVEGSAVVRERLRDFNEEEASLADGGCSLPGVLSAPFRAAFLWALNGAPRWEPLVEVFVVAVARMLAKLRILRKIELLQCRELGWFDERTKESSEQH